MKSTPIVFSNISANILIIVGVFLLLYMIMFEDEPGLIPLILITIGAVIHLVRLFANKRHNPPINNKYS